MRVRSIVAIAVLGALVSVLACTKGGSSGEIPVGEYGSLTGSTATFGQSTHNGVLMAFDEIDQAGGERLALDVDALGTIPVEATASGVRALAEGVHVRGIFENQPVELLNHTG